MRLKRSGSGATGTDTAHTDTAHTGTTNAGTTHTDTAHGRTDVVRGEPAGHHRVYDEAAARDRFGGVNTGASFFGWLVAIGMTVLLTGILAVIATALGYSGEVTQTQAERAAGTVTLVTAIVLVAVLLVAYYAGGYVAGRMSRFDGGRQGLAVWFIGLLVTVLAAVLGWIAGDQYNLFERLDVPNIPVPTQDVTVAGIVMGLVVLFGTLLAAMAGGKVGRRYHARVDRAAL